MAGEIVTGISVPKTEAGRRSTYLKVRDRESYAFALVSAAVALIMEGDRVRQAHIALGGVATRPWRAHECQSARKLDPLSASNVDPHVDDQHLDRPALAGVAEGEPGAGDGALRL